MSVRTGVYSVRYLGTTMKENLLSMSGEGSIIERLVVDTLYRQCSSVCTGKGYKLLCSRVVVRSSLVAPGRDFSTGDSLDRKKNLCIREIALAVVARRRVY